GLTLIEVMVIIVVLGLLIAYLLPGLKRAKMRADRIQCVNNLEQIGLGFAVWSGDHQKLFPMSVSQTNGGTMEFVTGTNAFRHFLAASNEVSTPWVLTCPADR